jgi:hypothetical protein
MVTIDVSITIQCMDNYQLYMKQIISKNRVVAEIVSMQPIVSVKSIPWHYLSTTLNLLNAPLLLTVKSRQ